MRKALVVVPAHWRQGRTARRKVPVACARNSRFRCCLWVVRTVRTVSHFPAERCWSLIGRAPGPVTIRSSRAASSVAALRTAFHPITRVVFDAFGAIVVLEAL